MPNHIPPEIGLWYQDLVDSNTFEVVAIDEDTDTIDIQYFDGEIQEFDFDSWENLEIIHIDQPEDWTGAYEVEREDNGQVDVIIYPEVHGDKMQEFDNYDLEDIIDFKGDDEV